MKKKGKSRCCFSICPMDQVREEKKKKKKNQDLLLPAPEIFICFLGLAFCENGYISVKIVFWVVPEKNISMAFYIDELL